MNPILISLLAKAVSGAYVGYITNDLAIQMLFRKRFGLGGIVLRTREQFIANISKLVERDIINHHTVERELTTTPQAFEEVLASLVNDFISAHLASSLPADLKLSEVPGLGQTVEQILGKLQPALAEFGTETLTYAAAQIPLTDLLSEPQLRVILARLTQLVSQTAAQTDTIPDLVASFYQATGHLTLAELVPAEIRDALRDRLRLEMAQAHVVLQDHLADEVDHLIQQVATALQMDQLVLNLAEELSAKKLIDIFGSGHTAQLSEEVAQRLRDIIGSEEGRQLISAFGDFVLEVLANEQTTVFELMSDNVAENFAYFLRAQLPGILKNLMEWLEDRQYQLEVVIDTTFRKNITSRFQDFIFRLFVGSVSQYAGIVDRLTKLVDKHRQNPDETATTLTEEVIDFLKGNTIGQIVTNIRTNAGLVRELDLGGVLLANIDQALTAKRLGFLNTTGFFERTLGELISPAEIHQFLQKSTSTLIEKELKINFIYGGKFTQLAMERLETKWQQIENQLFTTLFPVDKMTSGLSTWAKGQTMGQEPLADFLLKYTQGKTIGELIADLGIADWAGAGAGPLAAAATARLRTEVDQRGQQSVRDYLPRLTKVAQGLPIYLKKLLLGNLPALLQGRIEEVVKDSLAKMSPDKLLDLVEKFMGKELKPITLLGALLGGIAGVALAVLPSAGDSWTNTALAALAYGITGFSTNWLALKMIFRPYQKWKFLGWGVPLTPGVVAKNQGRFAENMGKFVAGGLLNPENLKHAFQQRQDVFRQRLTELLVADEAEIVKNALAKNQVAISNEIATKALSALHDPLKSTIPNAEVKPTLLTGLLAQLSSFLATQKTTNFAGANTADLEKAIHTFLQSEAFGTKAIAGVTHLLIQLKTNAKPLDISLASWQPVLAEWLQAQLGQWLRTANLSGDQPETAAAAEELVWEMILPRLDSVFARATASSLNQFINIEQQQKIKVKLGELLRQRLIDRELRKLIFNFIDNRLAEELSPDKKINEIFGGNVTRLLRQNMDTIVENLIQFGLDWLQENKEMLADQVYEKAYEQNRVGTFLYKSAVKGTVVELAEEGIPEFFRRESKSLKWLVADSVEQLGESRLSVLNIGVDEEYLKNLVDTFLGREEMHQAVERLLYLLLDELFKLPLSVFLGMAGVRSADDLFRIFRPEAARLSLALVNRLDEAQVGISQAASGFALRFLQHQLAQTSPAEVLGQVPGAAFAQLTDQWLGRWLASPGYPPLQEALVARLVAQAKQLPMGEMVDLAVLNTDLDALIRKFLAQAPHQVFLQGQLAQLLSANLVALPDTIAPETRQFLAAALVNAALGALENHLDPLIAALNLRKIVITEVTEMNPKEIEDLFYSFAGQYFSELINYGFGFGIVFGLVIDLALMYGLGWLVGKDN